MDVTFDTPMPGVVVAQPKRGFRYGSEAMWLVGAALSVGGRNVLDLGTGSGVVPAMLARHGRQGTGIDVRAEWGPLWEETRRRSVIGDSVRFVVSEVVDVVGSFDVVVSNPPYFRFGRGPTATDPWKRAARTESTADLSDFVAAAARCVTQLGTVIFVVPREREHEVPGQRVYRIGARRSVVVGSPGAPSPSQRSVEFVTGASWVERATRIVVDEALRGV